MAEHDDPSGSSTPGAPPRAHEPISSDTPDPAPGRASNRVLRFARRMMDGPALAEDTKELLAAVLTTSDKAKTEAVRMIAREVRNYLSELRLKEDLMELARSHSLEISISLKPLADAPPPESASEEEGEG